MKLEDENDVTESGEKETIATAAKYRQLFPNLLDPQKSNIEVGVTTKIRTNQTADAFIKGVQKYSGCQSDEDIDSEWDDEEQVYNWKPEKIEKDFLLFHSMCKEKIKQKSGKLPKFKTLKDFRKSELMTKIGEAVKMRLGLQREIDFSIIDALVKTCAYEYATYNDSPWCALFTNTELQVMEYYYDLKDYLEDAYGSTTYASSCLLFKDLLQKLNNSLSEPKKRNSYLYFSHAGALKRLWATLGLFSDQRLLLSTEPHRDFCDRRNRMWRTSLNTPFGAHLAIILYKCRQEKSDQLTFKLLTTVNTAPVTVKGCDGPVCDISQFQREYEPFANECDLDTLCV
ncbi:Multiple inositol polyphosphate phosphatase-like protein [Leptotrombidium deliense]|uniref:Multiple inositol polyphosphate phosphatase 1 n=1 Tax=Leptotrombidium deliense TaxID=299467 RepID=A0A443SCY2_9ACAR|nr:Multiple inositol polyphosphate phosphatase-like protein [Leptotrombidium deliense]